MVLQYIRLSLPYDFLEHLSLTKTQQEVRNFSAVYGHSGPPSDDVLANCKVTAKTNRSNVDLSFTSCGFQTQDNNLDCIIYKWKVGNEEFNLSGKSSELDCSAYSDSGESTPPSSKYVPAEHDYSRKRKLPKEETTGGLDLQCKKQMMSRKSRTTQSIVHVSRLTKSKLRKKVFSHLQIPRTSLRPKKKIDWSQINVGSGGEVDVDDDDDDDDIWNPDGEDDHDDDDDDDHHESMSPGKGHPRSIVLSPVKGHQRSTVLSPVKGHQRSTVISPVKGHQRSTVISPVKGHQRSTVLSPGKGHQRSTVLSLSKGHQRSTVLSLSKGHRRSTVLSPGKRHQRPTILSRLLGPVPIAPKPQSSELKASNSWFMKKPPRIPKIPKPRKSYSTKNPVLRLLDMAAAFPLQKDLNLMYISGGEQRSSGKCAPLNLVSINQTDTTIFEILEQPHVFFLSNISKDPDPHPKNYPKKFQVFSVKEGVSISIILDVKKTNGPREIVPLSDVEEKPTTCAPEENLKSVLIEKSNKVQYKDSRHTLENKIISLKHKLESSGLLTETGDAPSPDSNTGLSSSDLFSETVEEEATSDSEAEYPDEVQLVRAPRLTVAYQSLATLGHLTSGDFVTLQAGNTIPNLDFKLTSSCLLKTDEDRYYLQGEMERVDGLVLLGPFSMHYHPRPFLNFLPFQEPSTRVPKIIHERRRKRWLRKHDQKVFCRPAGGVLADQSTAFIDHDYFADANILAAAASEDSEDVVIVSLHGIDDACTTDNNSQDVSSNAGRMEDMIPVIGSLSEAMEPGKGGNQEQERIVLHEAQEEIRVDIDDLPMVTTEIVLSCSGVQTDALVLNTQTWKMVRKNVDEQKENQAPIVENDEMFQAHHVIKQTTCKYCLKLVANNFRLVDHIRARHRHWRGYTTYLREVRMKHGKQCRYCDNGRMFFSHDQLQNHLKEQHSDNESVAARTCGICDKLFCTRPILRRHMRRIHDNETYLCHMCPDTFKSTDSLASHIKGQHENIREHHCHICSGAYVTLDYLKRHIKKVHSQSEIAAAETPEIRDHFGAPLQSKKGTLRTDPVKQCFLCRHSFDARSMKKHMRKIHGIEWKEHLPGDDDSGNKCLQCSLQFATRADLDFHRYDSHDYNYHFNCPYCGNAYIHKKNMHDHILTLHCSIKLHQCVLCKTDCERAHILVEHMKLLHPSNQVGEDRRLTCIHCSATFKTTQELISHLASPAHYDYFPHKCLSCPQRFQEACDLEHHLLVTHDTDPQSQFELRCHNSNDQIVYLVLHKPVKQPSDLPPKARLALKRLQKEGKQVMIIAKADSAVSVENSACKKSEDAAGGGGASFLLPVHSETISPENILTPNKPLPQTEKASVSLKEALTPNKPLPQTENANMSLNEVLTPNKPLPQTENANMSLKEALTPNKPLPQTENANISLKEALTPNKPLPQTENANMSLREALTPKKPLPQTEKASMTLREALISNKPLPEIVKARASLKEALNSNRPVPQTEKATFSQKESPNNDIRKPPLKKNVQTSPRIGEPINPRSDSAPTKAFSSQTLPRTPPKTVYHVGSDGKITSVTISPASHQQMQYVIVPPPNVKTSSLQLQPITNVASTDPRAIILGRSPSKLGVSHPSVREGRQLKAAPPLASKLPEAPQLATASLQVPQNFQISQQPPPQMVRMKSILQPMHKIRKISQKAPQAIRTSQSTPNQNPIPVNPAIAILLPTGPQIATMPQAVPHATSRSQPGPQLEEIAALDEVDRAVASLRTPELNPDLAPARATMYPEVDDTVMVGDQEMSTDDILRLLQSTSNAFM